MFANGNLSRSVLPVMVVVLGSMFLPASGQAEVIYDTKKGPSNYDTVDINKESGTTITGTVDDKVNNIPVSFEGYGTDRKTPVILKAGGHDAKVGSAGGDKNPIYEMVITVGAGWSITAADFKLDISKTRGKDKGESDKKDKGESDKHGHPAATVTFQSFSDAAGTNLISPSGNHSFSDSKKRNHEFHLSTTAGSLIKTLVITSTNPIDYLKSLKLTYQKDSSPTKSTGPLTSGLTKNSPVPEPSTLLLSTLGGLSFLFGSRPRRPSRA